MPLHHVRGYLEPIGPPSAIINPRSFTAEAAAALQRATDTLKQLEEQLHSSGLADKVATRCSVQELFENNSELHANPNVRSELIKWHEIRTFPTGYLEEEEEGDRNEEDGDAMPQDDLPAIPSTDPMVIGLLEEMNTVNLKILQPIKDLDFYLRKTKTPDYNTLSELRNSSVSIAPFPPGDSPLASLVYSITIHPIPRFTNRSPFTTRGQTIVLLGNTSLWELQQNVLAGGDDVPEEIAEDGDADEEMEQNWEEARKRPKWGHVKRKAGSVWGVEGVLYADQGAGKVDYSQMLVNLIDSVEWSGKKQRAATPDSDLEVDLPPLSHSAYDQPKPQWRAGKSMQETRIGDLDVRVGEPYWYMHQGSCEHVWTVDRIRYIHPADPRPTTAASSAPYPVTTFLSRLTAAKCRLCDRDPGSIVTIDDELAGETPALMCAKCFELLHGDGTDVEWIPKLM